MAHQLEGTTVQAHLDFADGLPAVRVSATFRRNVLLATKESLNNVLKHAAARTVHVNLKVEDKCLVVCIEDDGRGFDPVGRASKGNGLTNIRRRVNEIAGDLLLTSRPGQGTSMVIRVPLSPTQ